jgi:hypothetical protein
MINPCLNNRKRITLVLVCTLLAVSLVGAVSAQNNTVVRAASSISQPHVGDTLTVNVTISNVQNLYGVDVMLNWNTSVLKVINAKSLLGVESHPEGVLHETASDPLYIAEDTAFQELGEYTLVATSAGSAPAFNGNGIIATVTFNVTNTGATGLQVISDLSDHPASGQNSNFIAHTDIADSVNVIPEYPSLIVLTLIIALATAALVFSKKRLSRNQV